MLRRCTLLAALLVAAPALGIQPGASGTVQLQNATADVVKVDGGDSASGTTRAANRQQVAVRRADDCTAQTDGVAGEVCADKQDGRLYVCQPSAGACDTPGEWALSPVVVYEGGALVSAACRSIDFSALFDVSESSGQCDVALGSTVVTTPTGDITKADLPPEVAYEDEANDFGAGQQTIENLDVENAAGTTVFDCNIAADGSCRYTGAYSHNDDVATKADVSARTTLFLSEWASTTATNYATRQYFRDNVRTSFVSAWARNSVPVACTTGTLNVRVTYFGASWPTGATLRVGYVKNSTGGTIIASCTVTDVGNCTDASTTTLSQGDTVHFFAQCEGTCTDNTIALAAEASLLCTAN